MKKLEYGNVQSKIKVSDTVDATRTISYQQNTVIGDRLRYEERHRVHNMDEAFRKVVEFARRIEDDDTLIDPAWRYEGKVRLATRGSFDVIFCYTIISVGKY